MSDKCAPTHISKIIQLCQTEKIEAKVLFDLVLIPTFSFNFTIIQQETTLVPLPIY